MANSAFGSTGSGSLIGNISRGLGFGGGQQPPPSNLVPYNQANGGLSPVHGLLSQNAPTTPVKSVTDSQGNTVTYHAPSTDTAPTQPTQPSAPQTGTPQYYAGQVQQASQPNALSTGAANASALYGMLGNQAQLQPFAGGQTQGLLQSYANLTRPQSTGNLQGEQGLFNVQQGILQNAANVTAQQALQQQQIQQQGAENLLGASLPGQIAGGTSLYSPLEGSSGFTPGTGITRQGAYTTGVQAYSNLQTGSALMNNISANEDLLTRFLGGVNPSDATPINSLFNKASQVFSGQDAVNFQAIIPTLRSQYSQLLQAYGSTPTTADAFALQQIPDNVSVGTLKSVLATMHEKGTNYLNSQQALYNQSQQNINNPQNPGTVPTTTTSAGSTNLPTWGDIFH